MTEMAPIAHSNKKKNLGKNQQVTQKLFWESLAEYKWRIVIRIFSFPKQLQRNNNNKAAHKKLK